MENSLSPYEIRSISSILRNATRKDDEPLNILLSSAHERYQQMLALTGHNFYVFNFEDSHQWNESYGKIPDNFYTTFPANTIPTWIDFDLVLCQSKNHYNIMKKLADILNIPIACLEHTFPPSNWNYDYLAQLKKLAGNINIFISDSNRDAFGWAKDEAYVIRHGIDTDLFAPANFSRKNRVLSVCNDFIRRDWACGYSLWKELINDLPYEIVGNTPGLSKSAESTESLIKTYQSSQIFLNTSLASPIPMSLLEAMSCGCAIVTTGTCAIPEIIENGVNGYISNDKRQLRLYLEELLEDGDKCKLMGENARKTIVENFDLKLFVSEWDRLFRAVARMEIGQYL